MAMTSNNECYSPASLRAKFKSSLCCFNANDIRNHTHHEILHQDHSVELQEGNKKLQTPRSPYDWLRSTAHELEIKDKCRGLIGRRGKNRRRMSHGSGDFRYDHESYVLNFEDDINKEVDDELPLSNFVARLPATPERSLPVQESATAERRELVLWS